jgi:endonuclease/exonuclease/phosphatase family metal-dependent hydrolase
MNAVLIAESVGDLSVLVNVHSNAKPIPDFPREEFINAGGLACHLTKVWEIEVLAHQIRPVLGGKRFVLGGDLNAGLLLDEVYGYKNNENLWNNLAAQGLLDLRTRHSETEQQTFFREKMNPYQLDHFFGDPTTEASVKGWTVLTEVARDLKLSDHAPVVIDLA